VRVAIDDFGTGWSSLDYLRRFTVDILKIDRAFVQGGSPADARGAPEREPMRSSSDAAAEGDLLAMIVDLARGLGVTLVAEGIERPVELERLRRLDVQLGQGFLFAPPMPLDRLVAFVRERMPDAEAAVP
jgi:EAL domain-containing protein (putative c-di-GMP-specific phosphodiesterase class I)